MKDSKSIVQQVCIKLHGVALIVFLLKPLVIQANSNYSLLWVFINTRVVARLWLRVTSYNFPGDRGRQRSQFFFFYPLPPPLNHL